MRVTGERTAALLQQQVVQLGPLDIVEFEAARGLPFQQGGEGLGIAASSMRV